MKEGINMNPVFEIMTMDDGQGFKYTRKGLINAIKKDVRLLRDRGLLSNDSMLAVLEKYNITEPELTDEECEEIMNVANGFE